MRSHTQLLALPLTAHTPCAFIAHAHLKAWTSAPLGLNGSAQLKAGSTKILSQDGRVELVSLGNYLFRLVHIGFVRLGLISLVIPFTRGFWDDIISMSRTLIRFYLESMPQNLRRQLDTKNPINTVNLITTRKITKGHPIYRSIMRLATSLIRVR